MSSLFFPAFLEMSQSALGAFMVLIHFHWINLCLTVHIHLSTSFPACSLLCFPRARTRTFVPKTASLPLYATLVQTHPGLPHRHGYYQQSLAGFITLWLSVFKIYRLAPYLLASTAAFYLNELFVLYTPIDASEHSKTLHVGLTQKDSGQQKMSNTNVCRGHKVVPWPLTAVVPLSSPVTQQYPKVLLWKAKGGYGIESTGVVAPERRRPGFRAILP